MKRITTAVALAGAFACLAETYNPPVLPPESEAYDVVVVGGTSAGVSAALGAKRAGARVLVVTSRPALLDDLTGHLLLDFAGARWKGGAFNDGLSSVSGGPFASYGDVTPLQLKRLGDEMLMNAKIPFRTFVSAVETTFPPGVVAHPVNAEPLFAWANA